MADPAPGRNFSFPNVSVGSIVSERIGPIFLQQVGLRIENSACLPAVAFESRTDENPS